MERNHKKDYEILIDLDPQEAKQEIEHVVNVKDKGKQKEVGISKDYLDPWFYVTF